MECGIQKLASRGIVKAVTFCFFCFNPNLFSQTIYVLNPWPTSSPQIQMGSEPFEAMNATEKCDWFVYNITNMADYKILLKDSYGSSTYGAGGIGDITPLDLNVHFQAGDTAYIFSIPQTSGNPQISASFPGIEGQCSFEMATTIWDFSKEHPDFEMADDDGVSHKGMVANVLGPDDKPVQGPVSYFQEDFNNWFRDKSSDSDPYQNNHRTCYNLPLQKSDNGLWKYDSYEDSPSKSFFPIDDFNLFPGTAERSYSEYIDKETGNAFLDPTGGLHNFHFCMEMEASFKYQPGQEFSFTGDDDLWVFINRELHMDLGAPHSAASGKILLDTLGLNQGSEYPFHLFYCERKTTGSNLLIETSIYFEQVLDTWLDTTFLSATSAQYDVIRSRGGDGSCSSADTVTVSPELSTFSLKGPGVAGDLILNSGSTSYGGISVHANGTGIIIDTALINQTQTLAPGTYTITATTSTQPIRAFNISFEVAWEKIVPIVINKAWMVDGNKDGRADSLFISFEGDLVELPEVIRDINWPLNGYEVKQGTSQNIFRISANTIVVDFSLNPFEFGQTGNLNGGDPNFTLADGTVGIIQDSIGPIALNANIVSPQIKYYVLESDPNRIVQTNPDTLKITLSEPMTASLLGDVNSFNTMLYFLKECDDSKEIQSARLTAEPLSEAGGLSLNIPLMGNENSQIIQPGDCIFLNPNSGYSDLKGNKPMNIPVNVEGNPGPDLMSTVLVYSIIGDVNSTSEFNTPKSNTVYILNDNMEQIGMFEGKEINTWIPPLFMTEDGKIDEEAQNTCNALNTPNPAPRVFSQNCLSAISVISKDSYTARINIFDHLGKYIHSSVQKFGFCGELDDANRIQPGGVLNFLIWNQKDVKGDYVGSGVYIWQVVFELSNGKKQIATYKQGISRGETPAPNCALF